MELLSGREKTDISESELYVPNITMTGYQILWFGSNYSEGKIISARETDKDLYNTTTLPLILVSTSTIGNR